jgi:molybdenum cofactor cytidylyltransferase
VKFGRMAVAAGEGAILAHSVKGPGVSLKKGEIISDAHIAALELAGIEAIVAAKLERGDVGENVAALRMAEAVAGANVQIEGAFTGRCNLMAMVAGLVCVDAAIVDAINAQDEAITVATLPPMRPVVAGEMVATIKIIPFAVSTETLGRSLRQAVRPSVTIIPFKPMRVGVVSTLLPGLKPATIGKTLRVLDERLEIAGAAITSETRVPHEAGALASAIGALRAIDLAIVFGASAITDRRDVVPLAIEMAGGRVDHLGMPVDPGNLLLLGRCALDEGRSVPVIGAPGCARSPKENGFDFVLRRLLAGLEIDALDLRGMGVGGLLSEIISRPHLRQPPEEP